MTEPNLLINIINNRKGYPAPRALLQRVLSAAWSHRQKGLASVTLLLVGHKEMLRMNRTFKNRNCDTDVLAFEVQEPDPATGVVHMGDIVVSVFAARREARQRKLRSRAEGTLYALHGRLPPMGMRDNPA